MPRVYEAMRGRVSGRVVEVPTLTNCDATERSAADRTRGRRLLAPLVLDVYEHAFQLDCGAAAAKCVDAFFANGTRVGNARQRARKAAAALCG